MPTIRSAIFILLSMMTLQSLAYTGFYTVPGGLTYPIKNIKLKYESRQIEEITYRLPTFLFSFPYAGTLTREAKDLYSDSNSDAKCFKSEKLLMCSILFTDGFKEMLKDSEEDTIRMIRSNPKVKNADELVASLKKFSSEGVGVLTVELK